MEKHEHINRRQRSTTTHSRSINMDFVLEEVGHFGLYQFKLFALVLIPVMLSAVYNSQYVFNAADIKYRCLVPECEKPPTKFKPGKWAEWALIPNSSCERRKPIGGVSASCEPEAFSHKTQACHAWVYETNNTIVAEFNLACKDFRRTLVGTIHSLGVFTCLAFIGIVSDSIGRRTTFIMTAVCGAIMGIIRSFATSYIFYVIFEYLDAVFGAGVYSTGFILVVEMVGNHKRVLCGSILAMDFASGQVSLAAVAWAVPYWRTLTRIIYGPSLVFISYFCCLSESVRWLISKEKSEKAIQVLNKVAAMNGKTLSLQTIKRITDAPLENEQNTSTGRSSVWKQVYRSGILIRRIVVCAFCWMTTTFVYYGLSINSVSLVGNMYVNFMLTAVVEIPGYALSNFLLDRFGRKRSIMAAYLMCGSFSLLVPIVPKEYDLYPTLVAKLFISLAFVSIYIFTTELFPTNARHTLMSTCSLIGRIGSILAPLSPLLLKMKYWLPYVLFGCVSFGAAMLLILTPETLRRPLPETISQAEDLHKTLESRGMSKTDVAGASNRNEVGPSVSPSSDPTSGASTVSPSK